ncbi:hypothetical protein JQC92_18220 [Shewanella sp. 202IG2-18]|uniref:hypothetical protein n=1 Tax=Parashewanella hymeniacidonis TaxID=2807618 RepID=UPI0019605688|nr:hypothetical protein [Parashewanella hymeniacidonis]MBM7073946.1 hypothetical protein [Parashewanella hymeniacidonis]
MAPISLAYAKNGAYVLIHYEHEAGQVDTGGFGEGISQEFSSLAYCELAAKTILQKLSDDGKMVEKNSLGS